MTVRELIERLVLFDEDMQVCVASTNRDELHPHPVIDIDVEEDNIRDLQVVVLRP